MTTSEVDQRIRSLRAPKALFDPYKAHGSLVEEERRPDGTTEHSLTVFLTGAECPFTCSFCDLWKWTIDGPTIPGALTTQLGAVLETNKVEHFDRIKLYNASNFFDQRSVPREDLDGIAALTAPFSAVTVESHASTIGPKTLEFARQIDGRLEVAIGLETINPISAAWVNKRLELSRFDAGLRLLLENGIDIRVFVLLGVPYTSARESIDWTVRTVTHAVERGASVVSVIPVRGGNGELERLQSLGHFIPPTLVQLEEALDACSGIGGAVVTADLWDVELLPACDGCRSERIARMKRINLTGHAESRVHCAMCRA